VPAEAVIIEAPVAPPGAGILDREEHFARKAVVADARYGPLDAPLVTGRSHACRIDMKVGACAYSRNAGVMRGARGSASTMMALVLSGIRTLKTPPKKRPRRFTRLNRARRRLLEGRIDEAMA